MKATDTTEHSGQENSQHSAGVVLRDIFLTRKRRNPQYSTRAFARDIGISQPFLSQVMNGKKSLSLSLALKITASLESSAASPEDAGDLLTVALAAHPRGAEVLEKAGRRQVKKASFIDIETARFKLISQWYHLPLLDLSTTQGFNSDPRWVARRLGISPLEAREAMERLVNLGLADLKQGKFRKTYAKISFPTNKTQAAVRFFHQQMIGKALGQLDKTGEQDFKARDISGSTLAIPKSRMEEAKLKIMTFHREMTAFLTADDCADEIYQLNVQLFPLTSSLSEG